MAITILIVYTVIFLLKLYLYTDFKLFLNQNDVYKIYLHLIGIVFDKQLQRKIISLSYYHPYQHLPFRIKTVFKHTKPKTQFNTKYIVDKLAK